MTDQAQQPEKIVIQDPYIRQFDGGFTAIPNRVLRSREISLQARMVYTMLLHYAWQDEKCFPGQDRLAADLGCSDRSIRTYLKELRDAELITWKKEGVAAPNTYYILRLPSRLHPVPGGDENGKRLKSQELSNPENSSGLTRQDAGDSPNPENISGLIRQQASGIIRKQASDYKDSDTKTQYTRRRRGVSDLNAGTESVAETVVGGFHRCAGHPSGLRPLKREIVQATRLLAKYDRDTVEYIVKFAVEKGAETNFQMQHFGAVLGYVDRALAGRAAIAARAEEQRRLADAREQEDAAHRAEQAAFAALPAEERARVYFERWAMLQTAVRKQIPDSEREAKWQSLLRQEQDRDAERLTRSA